MAVDQEFAPLSEPRARQLRGLVQAAFAAEGLQITFQGQVAVDAGGRRFGLHQLVADCATTLPDADS